jgi:hypothetical protein
MKNLYRLLASCLLVSMAVAQSVPGGDLERIFSDLFGSDPQAQERARSESAAYIEKLVELEVADIRSTLPFLLRTIREDDRPNVRLSASAILVTLAAFRRHDLLPIIEGYEDEMMRGFNDSDPRVKSNLMTYLALAEPAPPVETIEPFTEALMDDTQPETVQRAAILGLARAAPESLDAAEAIVGRLSRAEASGSRPNLIRALRAARPTHPVIVTRLIEELGEEDVLLREAVIDVIADIGTPAVRAAEKLRALADDPELDPELRARAADALDLVEGRRGVRPLP